MFLIDQASHPIKIKKQMSCHVKSTNKNHQNQNSPFSKIPDLNQNYQSIFLRTFNKVQTTNSGQDKQKFIKIVQVQNRSYLICVVLELRKKQLIIELKFLEESLTPITTSKYRTLHLISYFSKTNPSLAQYSFRINPKNLEICMHCGFLAISKQITNNKIDEVINQMIEIFQEHHRSVNVYVSETGMLNQSYVVLNVSIEKYMKLIQQLMAGSCKQMSQILPTPDEKNNVNQSIEEKQIKTQQYPLNFERVYSMMGIPNNTVKSRVGLVEMRKMIEPLKESNDKQLNQLCMDMKIKQSRKLKWINFYENSNTKMEVADAHVELKGHPGVYKRSLVEKKPKTKNALRQIENSKYIYNGLRGKNCVYIQKSYTTTEEPFNSYFLTDYCKHGSLSSYIKLKNFSLSLKMKVYFMMQIATSLQFLSHERIIHCDVKPDNFLVSADLWVKLTDFGEARFKNQNRRINGWTPPYAAPQLVNEQKLDYSSDIYSFGVLMYQLVTGNFLFQRNFQGRIGYNQFPRSSLNPQILYKYGPKEIMVSIYELIVRCVDPVKELRPPIEFILLVLKCLLSILQYLVI